MDEKAEQIIKNCIANLIKKFDLVDCNFEYKLIGKNNFGKARFFTYHLLIKFDNKKNTKFDVDIIFEDDKIKYHLNSSGPYKEHVDENTLSEYIKPYLDHGLVFISIIIEKYIKLKTDFDDLKQRFNELETRIEFSPYNEERLFKTENDFKNRAEEQKK